MPSTHFEWIEFLSPYLTALITSIFAIWFARYNYRSQKEEDRKLRIKELQIELYTEYLKELTDDVGCLCDGSYQNDPTLANRHRYLVAALRAKATLCASKSALDQMDAIADCREQNDIKKYLVELRRFAHLARNDVFPPNYGETALSEKEIDKYLPFAIRTNEGNPKKDG